MRFTELEKEDRLILSSADIARILSIDRKSAYVAATRYKERGLLIKLKRDFFIIASKIKSLTDEQLFAIANRLQVPSYVSFG